MLNQPTFEELEVAYHEGYQAGLSHNHYINPYSIDDPEFSCYLDGFNDGRLDQ